MLSAYGLIRLGKNRRYIVTRTNELLEGNRRIIGCSHKNNLHKVLKLTFLNFIYIKYSVKVVYLMAKGTSLKALGGNYDIFSVSVLSTDGNL